VLTLPQHYTAVLTHGSASLKCACPKGVYITPLPDEPFTWSGVLFVRKGMLATTETV